MDYTLLYAAGITIFIIAGVFGFLYLKRKGKVNAEDLETISSGLIIASTVLTTLGVKATAKNKKILEIVSNAMAKSSELLKDVKDDNLDEIKADVYATAITGCEEAALKLSDKEKELIKNMSDTVVTLSYTALKETK